MRIRLDYSNGEFFVNECDLSQVRPFGRAEVEVNCDQPLCRTTGPLEHEVEGFLNKLFASLKIKAQWDPASDGYRPRPVERYELPRISKLLMGVNFEPQI